MDFYLDTLRLVIFIAIPILFILWYWIFKVSLRKQNVELRKRLRDRPNWHQLRKVENRYLKLTSVDAAAVSRRDIRRYKLTKDDYIYGEIHFISFAMMLEKVDPQPDDIFYDLGSGAGKAVMAAAMLYNFSAVYGIEQLPGLHALANQLLQGADLPNVYFIQGNFLELDFSSATIVFINATCFTPSTWEQLTHKLGELQVSTRIIVITKRIHDKRFALISQSKELMSWGLSNVSIYKKIA